MKDQPSSPTPSGDLQRRLALRLIAELSEQHHLPMPLTIQFDNRSNEVSICTLRLVDESREAVTSWAAVLNLGEVEEAALATFTSVKADRWGATDAGPLGEFVSVTVWAACDLKAGEK